MNGSNSRAAGDVKAVEYDLAPGRTRWALLHTPADTEPVRLNVPSDFLEHLGTTSPRNTQRAFAHDLALWFGWCAARGLDWRDADGRSITAFVTALQVRPKGRPLHSDALVAQLDHAARGDSTVRRAVQSVKAVYAWAQASDLVDEHVAARIAAVAAPRRRRARIITRLEPEEVPTLLAAAGRHPGDRLFVGVMHGCGLRISEALGLRFEDLHFETNNRSLHDCKVPGPHLHVVPRPPQEVPPGVSHKFNKERIVPVDAHLLDVYSAYIVHRMAVLGDDDFVPFVFVSFHGTHKGAAWSMSAGQKRIRRLAERLGWQGKLHPHVLRHTYASELDDANVSLERTQALLGHASPESAAIYIHPHASRLIEATATLTAYRKQRYGW